MTLDEQIKIMNEYKDGKQIYRCRRFSSDIESEKVPLYNENDPHDFDFHSYAYSLNEITWKDFSQEVAFKYRLWNVYGTASDKEGNKYVTSEDALKLFNDGVEYGMYASLKTSKEYEAEQV